MGDWVVAALFGAAKLTPICHEAAHHHWIFANQLRQLTLCQCVFFEGTPQRRGSDFRHSAGVKYVLPSVAISDRSGKVLLALFFLGLLRDAKSSLNFLRLHNRQFKRNYTSGEQLKLFSVHQFQNFQEIPKLVQGELTLHQFDNFLGILKLVHAKATLLSQKCLPIGIPYLSPCTYLQISWKF
jgi:hypothetical protein